MANIGTKSEAEGLGYLADPVLDGLVGLCVKFGIPASEVGPNWDVDAVYRYAYSKEVVDRTRAALVSHGELEVDSRPLWAMRVDDERNVGAVFDDAVERLRRGEDVETVRQRVSLAVNQIRYAAQVETIRKEVVGDIEILMIEARVPERGCSMAAYPYGFPTKYGIRTNSLNSKE